MYTEEDYNTGEFNLLRDQRYALKKALIISKGNTLKACRLLKISKKTVYRMAERHQLTSLIKELKK